jgi:PAS domain S-box-containing protein
MEEVQDSAEKLKVLVIEDNRGDFVLIQDHLEEKFDPIEITHFPNFSQSKDYLENLNTEVSLILLDLNLPDISGIDLVKKALAYNIPIVILTGLSDLSLSKKSLQLGVCDYLIKDEINTAILFKTITYALNRSSFIREIETEKENYENLFHFNPQPTWLLDSKTLKILNANEAAQKKYGFFLDEFLKLSFTQLHPDEEEDSIIQNFNEKSKASTGGPFTHYLSNGNEIKVELYFQEIKNEKQSRLIVQSNDISEKLKHIKTIEAQNANLRKIAWTQSNVMHAPISRILEIIKLMEEQPDDVDKIVFWLKKIKTSTTELDDIIKKTTVGINHPNKN